MRYAVYGIRHTVRSGLRLDGACIRSVSAPLYAECCMPNARPTYSW